MEPPSPIPTVSTCNIVAQVVHCARGGVCPAHRPDSPRAAHVIVREEGQPPDGAMPGAVEREVAEHDVGYGVGRRGEEKRRARQQDEAPLLSQQERREEARTPRCNVCVCVNVSAVTVTKPDWNRIANTN